VGSPRRVVRPPGSWSSPLSAERVSAAGLRLSQPRWSAGELCWLEGRPLEGGRQVVMAARDGDAPRELSPPGVSVRTRVHEYGGGDYALDAEWLVFSRDDDRRVYRMPRSGGEARALTDGSARHADFAIHPDGRWLVAVEERPRPRGEPENRLVALPLAGGPAREVAAGWDFVSFPRFSPDGRRLAFTAWSHPHMPWDATELWEVEWTPSGPGERRQRAGGAGESIFQPGYSPAGVLTFASDRSGWWNLEQLRGDRRVALCPRAAEFGRPQWVFGLSTWGFVDERTLLCAVGEGGRQRLARLALDDGSLRFLAPELDSIDGLEVAEGRAALIGASSTRAPGVGVLELAEGSFRPVRDAFQLGLGSDWIAVPESLEFATGEDERAHAFLYRPAHPECEAPPGTRPPLLVKSHGGPTAASGSALDPAVQFWTSRGFALLDVNYRGSTGFGRAYRERLRGQWGVVDVEDCVAAARFAADEGIADGERLAIRGGSAGGFTTLCALTFHDRFRAGASYYGIGDLEALARDTHKFEARYLDGLVGPYPERRALYRARSPIHHADQLSCPVIFFQGLEDRVVPPAQSEAMAAALAERGIPHAYVAFPGEQHGFRRAESQRRALEAELWFYARVLGFPGPPPPDGVALVAGRADTSTPGRGPGRQRAGPTRGPG
jgi:dipeptidyl aminopeptidase/acylaminoacyl peptidase